MPSKAEIARRAARRNLQEVRAATIRAAFPGVNVHLAGEVACSDRLWGPDALWREFVADANTRVNPCQLSCCNPDN